jgi:hypothetical protein
MHVRTDPRDLAILSPDVGSTAISFELIEKAKRDAAEAAKRARGIFDAAVKRHALALRDAPPPIGTGPALLREASACWREEMGHGARRIADRARLFDLIILGRAGRVVDESSGETIEEALLKEGPPVVRKKSGVPSCFSGFSSLLLLNGLILVRDMRTRSAPRTT